MDWTGFIFLTSCDNSNTLLYFLFCFQMKRLSFNIPSLSSHCASMQRHPSANISSDFLLRHKYKTLKLDFLETSKRREAMAYAGFPLSFSITNCCEDWCLLECDATKSARRSLTFRSKALLPFSRQKILYYLEFILYLSRYNEHATDCTTEE
jgi:hypothetical protein